jgi:4-hydroxybenzoate polyprenyltransferase
VYGLLFILTGIFGALLTTAPLDLSLVVLIVFIAASSAFGFVINDISDVALDAIEKNPRNPLADGTLSCRAAWVVCGIFLAVSLVCMVLLPLQLLPIEITVLFVLVTYSFFISVKNIAGLDLVYHGIGTAAYGLLGYMLYHPIDLTGITFTTIIGIFGVISEMGNEIRDLETDRHVRKNTVVLLGERLSFILTIALLLAAFVIIGVFSCIQPGYLWLLPFLPFGIFLVHPMYKAMMEPAYRKKFFGVIIVRATILAAAMLVVYIIIRGKIMG